MAKWTIPDDLIPRSEAVRMAQEARGAALKEAASECVFVDGISGDERWQEPRAIQRAIISLDPDAVRAHDAAIREAVLAEREACAKVAESFHEDAMKWASVYLKSFDGETDSKRIAAAIRARGGRDALGKG